MVELHIGASCSSGLAAAHMILDTITQSHLVAQPSSTQRLERAPHNCARTPLLCPSRAPWKASRRFSWSGEHCRPFRRRVWLCGKLCWLRPRSCRLFKGVTRLL